MVEYSNWAIADYRHVYFIVASRYKKITMVKTKGIINIIHNLAALGL